MNKHERVRAALRRQPIDRVPVAMWRHFPEEDQTAAGLARAVSAFHRRYDFDFAKVTPASDYMAVDWGLKGEYCGSLEGTRQVTARPIGVVADWEKLQVLDPTAGSLGLQLDALWLLSKDLAGEAPFLQTIFSPLTTARKVAGNRWRDDLRAAPELMHRALAAIAETTAAFAVQSLRAGANGIFFATQVAGPASLTEAEHRDFGERYDRQVLDAVAAETDLIVLHLHGEPIMFGLANSYPAAAVNWHDRRTAPSLREALDQVSIGLIGGLDELHALRRGSPAEVAASVDDAIAQTAGRGLIVGPGCVIHLDTPDENIRAAVAAARAHSLA